MVRCRQCGESFNKRCVGLPAKACLSGAIDHCVDCAMFELKILDAEAADAAAPDGAAARIEPIF